MPQKFIYSFFHSQIRNFTSAKISTKNYRARKSRVGILSMSLGAPSWSLEVLNPTSIISYHNDHQFHAKGRTYLTIMQTGAFVEAYQRTSYRLISLPISLQRTLICFLWSMNIKNILASIDLDYSRL